MFQRVEKLRLVDQSIDNLLVRPLSLKCSKHTVPDDEDAGIVLVQTIPIGT